MYESKNQSNYISFISVISAFAVVVLHANGCFWNFSSTDRYWKTANVIECIFYFAVPVFFMISGATLFDFFQRYSLKEFFSRRIRKTVIPYIFWSFFGLAFQVYYLKSIERTMVNGKYVMNSLLSGNSVRIYWFFIPLFCIYLSIPLFAAVREDLRKRVFIYLAVICFILNCIIPFINSVFHIGIGYQLSVTVGSDYLLYLILGYLLHKYELKFKWRCLIYVLGVTGLLLHIIGTYQLSMAEGQIVSTYKGYTNLPCVLYSVAVFVFAKHTWGGKVVQIRLANRITSFLRDYTFGLYLVHWYVMQAMIKVFGINIQSIYFRLGAPFVIVAVSVLFIYAVRKIPLVGRMLLP